MKVGSALARRSVRTLERFGVWTHAREQAHPIRHVRVSSRGDFGAVRLHADDYGVPALGWTTPARVLGRALETTAAMATVALGARQLVRPLLATAAGFALGLAPTALYFAARGAWTELLDAAL